MRSGYAYSNFKHALIAFLNAQSNGSRVSDDNQDELEPDFENHGDYCRGCLYEEDPCHYLCRECENGNNREQHPGYCIHDVLKTEKCLKCENLALKREILELKQENEELKRLTRDKR